MSDAVAENLRIIYNILLSKRQSTFAIDVNIHKIFVRRRIRCDTFMSAIPRRSNSRRVAKAGGKERRDREGWIRGGKNLPIISIVTVRSTFSSRHEKPFSSTLASRHCEFIHVKGIRSGGKERHVRKYDILLRERPFECPREM